MKQMTSSVRALAWLVALAAVVYAVYSVVTWVNRPPLGGPEQSEAPAALTPASAVAAEAPAQPPAATPTSEAPAAPPTPAGQAPAYQTRRTSPGEELYRAGQYEKAIEYWTGMAKQGDVESNYRLGREYTFSPSGTVQRDFKKAFDYHMVASKLGDPRAMFEIATFYEYAMGLPKDIALAAKWYKYAADYGHAQGQYNYATMAETGEGVPKDLVEAYLYYRLAAQQGFYGVPFDAKENKPSKSAEVPIETLEKGLTKEQVKEGEKRLAAFKVRTGPLEP
jgi:TPR repeat protein